MLPPIFTFVDWQREPWHLVEWPLRPTLTFLGFAPNLFSHIEEGGQPWTEIHTFYLLRKSQQRIPSAALAPIMMYMIRPWLHLCKISVSTYWVVDSSKHSECTFENIQFSFLFVFIHSLTLVNTKRWTRRALNQHWGFVLGERDLYGSFNFNWTQVAQSNIAQFLTLFFWGKFK